MARKTDTVEDYIGSCSAGVRPLMKELRDFVCAELPGATEEMQFGVPVFLNAQGVPVIYLFGSKKHVNFGFLKSAKLIDPDGVLKGSGKPSKHVRIVPGEPVDKAMLSEFLKQCETIGS